MDALKILLDIEALKKELREKEIEFYNVFKSTFADLVRKHNGVIDLFPLVDSGELDDCDDNVWVDVNTRNYSGCGVLWKVCLEKNNRLIFYGYTDNGNDCYQYYDNLNAEDVYHLYKLFEKNCDREVHTENKDE